MFRSRNDDGFRSRDHNGHRRTWIGFLFGWIVDAWYFVAGFFRQIFQFQWFWRPLRRFTKRFFAFEIPSWVGAIGDAALPPTNKIQLAHYFNPICWFSWTYRFVGVWLLSRPYLNLGPALPSIVVTVTILVLFISKDLQDKSVRSEDYRSILTQAMRSKNFDTAMVAVGTLIDMNPDNLDYRFQRALIEGERGNAMQSRMLCERLAILEGHTPAAIHVLFNVMKFDDFQSWKAEDHLRFRGLIDIALKGASDADLSRVNILFASYLNAIGNRKDAIRHLSTVTGKNPGLSYTLAMLQLAEKDFAQARSNGQIAKSYFEKVLLKEPQQKEVRLNLARTLILLEEEEEASKLLLEGFRLTEDIEFKNAAADALVQYSNRLGNTGDADALGERMQIIKQAVDIAPDSGMVIDAVIDLVVQVQKDEKSEAATLRKVLVDGVAADTAHFIQGTVALLENDIEQAEVHLKQAAKANPNLPGILNNLAVAMSAKEDADLGTALNLANAAVERMPNHPYLRETRGQILFKMKKYGDAIGDLEFALKADELAEPIHRSLAEIYDALGQKELAEGHRNSAVSSQNRPKQ